MRKLFLTGLCFMMIVLGTSNVYAEYQYGPGPPISIPVIMKSVDMQWFHVSEECMLKVKAVDRDVRRELPYGQWEEMEENFVDFANCAWSGFGIIPDTKGETAPWAPPYATSSSGANVSVTVMDYTNIPHYWANDTGNTYNTRLMYAYEAVAYLNCTSSNSGSPTRTVYEKSGTPQQCNLSFAEATVVCGGNDTKSIEAWGTATWRIDTSPTCAFLGSSGQLSVPISVNASGALDGKVGDNDIIDGSFSVGVSLGASGGLSAAVSVEFPIQMDSVEGAVGAGFAFSSDHLGDDTNTKLEMISGDDPDPLYFYYDIQSENFSKNTSVTFRGGKTSESKAKAVIEGTAKTVGPANSVCAELGSRGSVIFTVGVPTYEPGQAPGPEEGY